jgi:glycerol-3-phosphate dehydrogenase
MIASTPSPGSPDLLPPMGGSRDWRREVARSFRENPSVPVLILGGGINGIGLFRELALQGVDCLLVERSDFSSGATSNSSRMIHGGLRYLENREFGLVREALLERNRLLANAPHFVAPLRTTIPLFSRWGGTVKSPLVFLGLPVKPGGRGSLVVKLGLTFYDLVTRKNRRTPTHFFTSREESLRAHPGLNPSIIATATYWDAAITQAERLAIEMVRDALAANPRCRALHYAAPRGLEGGAVAIADSVTGESFPVRPRVVVNATGAWVDIANGALGISTRFMRGTKGSHLVVDHRPLRDALAGGMVYYEHSDGRVCIVFPFEEKVIAGSTDIPIDDPDAARCDDAEVAYMLASLRGVFPGIEIPPSAIVHRFCGVRPLPAAGDRIAGTITRGHTIAKIEPGGERPFPVLCLIGGKWTTFRALAESAADRVLRLLGAPRRVATEALPIGGGRNFPAGEGARERWIGRVAAASGLGEERAAALLERFGTLAEPYALGTGGKETPIETLPGYTREEIAAIAAGEAVEHLSDLVFRRSTIGILGGTARPVLEEIAGVLAGPLGWDRKRIEDEVARTIGEENRR